jgi:hypothetical protein
VRGIADSATSNWTINALQDEMVQSECRRATGLCKIVVLDKVAKLGGRLGGRGASLSGRARFRLALPRQTTPRGQAASGFLVMADRRLRNRSAIVRLPRLAAIKARERSRQRDKNEAALAERTLGSRVACGTSLGRVWSGWPEVLQEAWRAGDL